MRPNESSATPGAAPDAAPDLEKIRQLQQRAFEEKWPFPKLFDALKDIGVERYEVNVLTLEIKYVGGGSSAVQPAPDGRAPLVAGAYSLDGVKQALRRRQAGETTFPQFIEEMAAAGVSFYRIDMKPRTATYHGPKPYKYVESIPPSA